MCGEYCPRVGLERQHVKSNRSFSRFVKEDRQSTMASAEKSLRGVISQRERETRPAEDDKSSFGNAGKSTPSWWSDRRRGADPPRNESGRVGDTATCERKRRSVSAGYGSYVTFLFLV